MPDGFVTIANFTIPLDAEMARMKLESEEIPVFLVDSHTTGLYPAWGGAIGVRLQVPFECAEDATSLLESKDGEENLVQMVIRDGYPEFYHNYLLKRVDDKDTPWDKLAKETGLKDEEVKSIERTIEKERETLIQQEYDYVTGTYQIYDGSPSYVWECERVANIRPLEVFRGLKFSSDRCSDGGK